MTFKSKPVLQLVLAAATAMIAENTLLADLIPAWTARVPIGASLSAGMGDMVDDDASATYITGTSGPSGNNDIATAAFAPDGTWLWSRTFDGVQHWHDQGRGITLGPDGSVWVCGNTPAADSRAKVLALKYDVATGDLLRTIEYTSDPAFAFAQHAQCIAVDAQGNVYLGGGTAMFTIVNATPNRNQYIVYSLRGLGSTFVPQLNVTLDLRQPVLLTAGRADANGDFTTTVHVPRAATGRTVWFQGAEMNRTTAAFSEAVQ